MDYKIIFSGPAIADLREIVSYIAIHNSIVAERFGKELIDRSKPLSRFPRLGRMVPEEDDENLREIVFKSYRIFYRVNDASRLVEIVRFWHAARGTPEIPNYLD